MNPADLLRRIAKTLRDDVGPAVAAEYPKTQAFMAAVVLEKLGRELALAEAHRAADALDVRALQRDLAALRAERAVPAGVGDSFDRFAAVGDAQSLSDLIATLYAARAALGDDRFDALLGRVRKTLRAQIDRRMEFAK